MSGDTARPAAARAILALPFSPGIVAALTDRALLPRTLYNAGCPDVILHSGGRVPAQEKGGTTP